MIYIGVINMNCDNCKKEISQYEYNKNKGLCNECVDNIN